ncbi:MAG: DUF4843 domain-containing protein [Bacteroidales bacterium]|nr:DUF4843 domain-containing protein [Bacteroidales bacterium]
MKQMKNILLKIFVLAIFVFAMNYIYEKWFYEKGLQEYSDIINLVRKVQNNSDIIYIAESSNYSTRANDTDKRAISEFISEYYPNKRLGTIHKGALHAGNYKILLEQIPEDSDVETIIVTLNMRSFDAAWIYSNLETALQKSMVLLKPYPALFNRFLLSFKGYDVKTDKEREVQFKRKWEKDKLIIPQGLEYKNVIEWDKTMAREGIKNIDGTINYKTTALACHYIKTYAFQIDINNNPRIKDFDAIVKLAEKRNWNLVFNLMAENLEKAEELVGDNLVYLINENRKLLIERYTNMGVLVVDNVDNISDNQFTDQHWTTEHYAENGRKIIARNVADSLKGIYPTEYFKVKDTLQMASCEFFHDCENKSAWKQMNTITKEQAYSGEKSSKTGQGDNYSITFEWPIVFIPDSMLKTIEINLKILQKEINHDVMLVIDASGYKIENFLHEVPVSELSDGNNTWENINYKYNLPEEIKKGSLLKVYIYNPTKSIVYIDDLKIKFYPN